MTFLINGITYNLVATDECDEQYEEFEIISADGTIGTVSRYTEQNEYSAWDINGRLVAIRKTLKGTVTALVTN